MQTSLSFIQCVVVFKMLGLALGSVETSSPEERTTILDGLWMGKIDQRWDQILGDQFAEFEVNNYSSILHQGLDLRNVFDCPYRGVEIFFQG